IAEPATTPGSSTERPGRGRTVRRTAQLGCVEESALVWAPGMEVVAARRGRIEGRALDGGVGRLSRDRGTRRGRGLVGDWVGSSSVEELGSRRPEHAEQVRRGAGLDEKRPDPIEECRTVYAVAGRDEVPLVRPMNRIPSDLLVAEHHILEGRLIGRSVAKGRSINDPGAEFFGRPTSRSTEASF